MTYWPSKKPLDKYTFSLYTEIHIIARGEVLASLANGVF